MSVTVGNSTPTPNPQADAAAGGPVSPDDRSLAPSVSHQSAAMKTALSKDASSEPELDLGFLSPAEQPDELGRLAGYRVLQELGHGGMGAVFLAEDPKLKRKVALKVMLPHVARVEANRERFLREAQAAAQLEHDNILTIHHVGEANGVPFIAMPFLKGESLHSRLQREPVLPLADVLRIGGQIAEGLAAAHDLNLIHRDIKPANIWLEDRRAANPPATVATLPATPLAIPSFSPATPLAGVVPAPLRYDPSAPTQQTGSAEAREPLGQAQVAGNSANTRVKILDFGLARLATSGDEQHLTTSGTILGTPSYMAPEQAQGANKVDHRCDLFSLGAVLYRMATGKLPFTGDGIMQLMYALANSTPDTPSDLNPTLPRELSDLIEQLLAKHPTARPATAHEVARRLSELSHTPPATPLATTTSLPATPLAGVVPALLRYPAPTASTSQSTASQPAVAQKRGNHPDEQGGGGKTGVASEHSHDVSTMILPAAARRRRTLWLSVAVVVLVLAAGAVFQLVSNSRHPQAPLTSTGEPAGVSPRTNSPANNAQGLTPPGSPNDAREPRAPQTDHDRDVAEYVLSIGGTLKLVKDGTTLSLVPGDKLPESPFVIGTIDITALRVKQPNFDYRHALRKFSGLSGLQELLIHDNPVTNDDLAQLSDVPKLRVLHLQRTQVTDACMDSILRAPSIEILHLSRTKMTPAIVPKLKSLPKLFQLGVDHWPFNAGTASGLGELTTLRHLDLDESWLSEAGIDAIKNLSIESLGVAGNPKDESLSRIQSLPKLWRFTIKYPVKSLPSLTASGFKSLAKLPRFTSLQGDSFPFTDEHLSGIAEIEQLETFQMFLYGTMSSSITDAGLEHLQRLPNLKSLTLMKTQITPAGLARFRAAKPNCQVTTDVK